MDFKGLNAGDVVRLKFFLARQCEGRHTRRRGTTASKNLPEQQAAILACLAWMENYAGGQMAGCEICRLLSIRDTRLSTVMRQMKDQGLVTFVDTDDYYQITSAGVERLSEFADRVLGIPKTIESELEQQDVYRELMAICQRLIDNDLGKKFVAAKES